MVFDTRYEEWLLDLNKFDREKTAFSTSYGLW